MIFLQMKLQKETLVLWSGSSLGGFPSSFLCTFSNSFFISICAKKMEMMEIRKKLFNVWMRWKSSFSLLSDMKC